MSLKQDVSYRPGRSVPGTSYSTIIFCHSRSLAYRYKRPSSIRDLQGIRDILHGIWYMRHPDRYEVTKVRPGYETFSNLCHNPKGFCHSLGLGCLLTTITRRDLSLKFRLTSLWVVFKHFVCCLWSWLNGNFDLALIDGQPHVKFLHSKPSLAEWLLCNDNNHRMHSEIPPEGMERSLGSAFGSRPDVIRSTEWMDLKAAAAAA